MDDVRSRIRSSIDLEEMGHQVGELMIPWSDNTVPLGYHPIPIINIKSPSTLIFELFDEFNNVEFIVSKSM